MDAKWQARFDHMDRSTFEYFAEGGKAAGEAAGHGFQAWCAEGSGKDPKAFPNALAAGISSAKEQMLQAGANDEQVEVWRFAFREALEPYTRDRGFIFD